MAAHNDDSGVHAITKLFSIASYFFNLLLEVFSNCFIIIDCLCQSMIGTAGLPPTILPASIFCATPPCAATCAPSPIFRCPAIPTCPPRAQYLPIVLLPAIPVCATIIEPLPILTPCPICTKLSMRHKSFIIVS